MNRFFSFLFVFVMTICASATDLVFTTSSLDRGKAPTRELSTSTNNKLKAVTFNTGFRGAIYNGRNSGRVDAYYMPSQVLDEPFSIKSVELEDPKASYKIRKGTQTYIDVTAENGEVFQYRVNALPVNPLPVPENIPSTAFTSLDQDIKDSQFWVYNLNSFNENTGVMLSRNDENGANCAAGKTRVYFFIEPAISLTLTSSSVSRAVEVYVNGETSPEYPTTTVPSGRTMTIPLDPTQNNMVMIETTQSAGSASFSAYAVVHNSDEVTFTANLVDEYTVPKASTVRLTVAASNAESYQWYTNTVKSTTGAVAVEGATSASYMMPSGENAEDVAYAYCVASNAESFATSNIAKITTIGATASNVLSASFGSSPVYYAAITHPDKKLGVDGVIEVPYLAGTNRPELMDYTVSPHAEAEMVGANRIHVVAEDGVSESYYDIVFLPITPLNVSKSVAETAFSDVPSWVYSPSGFNEEYGLTFTRASDENLTLGKARQYYFVGPAGYMTLTSSMASRAIKVYCNGLELAEPNFSGAVGQQIQIPLNVDAPTVVMIESNQQAAMGAFSHYSVGVLSYGPETTFNLPAVEGTHRYGTFSSTDITFWPKTDPSKTFESELYQALLVNSDIYLTSLEEVECRIQGVDYVGYMLPANTGVLLESDKASTVYYTVHGALVSDLVANRLRPSSEAMSDANLNYKLAYSSSASQTNLGFYWGAEGGAPFTIGDGKAYLAVPKSAGSPSRFVFGPVNDVSTSCETIESEATAVKRIVDGQLMIVRDGKMYDALGRMVR